MASLRDTVKDYQEELRDGIAWVAFWKTGRSWNAEYFHLEMSDYIYPEDRSRMEEIKQADPAAVVVNGYYSGYLGEDMNLDELTYLKTVREKEVAELIKEARGFGDLSENSEYDEAKNEQGKLYSRIAELEDILLHVVIIDESEGASNAVSIGCTVTVVDLKTGREMPPYKVVGSQEADPMHRAISEESPFGKALMGAKEGDEISVEAPVGIIHYRVEKIER